MKESHDTIQQAKVGRGIHVWEVRGRVEIKTSYGCYIITLNP